jgi:predicted dehydrogenase
MLQRMTEPDRSAGEGMIYTAGSHSLDHALRLFGRPSSVTGFLRVLRGIPTSVEDTFTITLAYTPDPLIVHVKTNVVSTMPYQLTFFIRGSKGSFVKFGQDEQNVHVRQGLLPGSPDFGKEPEEMWGLLATRERVTDTQVPRGDLWWGKVPSEKGDWRRFYVDLVKAIRGEGSLVIDPQLSRDGVRVIELAIESATQRGVRFRGHSGWLVIQRSSPWRDYASSPLVCSLWPSTERAQESPGIREVCTCGWL